MKDIRISTEEYAAIERGAAEKSISPAIWLRSRILGDQDALSRGCIEAAARAAALPVGTQFTLKALFTADWAQFDGIGQALGKEFAQMVRSGIVTTVCERDHHPSDSALYERV